MVCGGALTGIEGEATGGTPVFAVVAFGSGGGRGGAFTGMCWPAEVGGAFDGSACLATLAEAWVLSLLSFFGGGVGGGGGGTAIDAAFTS